MHDLLRFCQTERQREVIQALIDNGSHRKAAKALGVGRTTIQTILERIKLRAAQMGWAPDDDLIHPVPEGLALKGTSIRYNREGGVEQYWNKTKQAGRPPEETVQLPDPKVIKRVSTLYDQMGQVTQQWVAEEPKAAAKAMLWTEFANELAKDLPRIEPVPAAKVNYAANIAACYPVGDHHFGMLSWAPETGADYDLDIADRRLTGAFDHLIQTVPRCDQAYVIFLGDFLHYDSFEAATPTSGNMLDADGRFPKMVSVAVKAMRRAIDQALKHHLIVHVIIEIGNHDLASAVWLQVLMAAVYENEPRVTIDTSPSHFHYFEFGKNLVGIHHGHGVKKMDKLPLIMATDMPAAWGRTKYRFWWTGHVHHDQVKDYEGCKVESMRVLPPGDAWHANSGYRASCDMKAIVLHKEYGEIARHTFNPAMLES